MLCKIADLLIEIPDAGGLASRCSSYLWDGEGSPDIVICEKLYKQDFYHQNISRDNLEYMESSRQFYGELLYYDGLYLHSSAVELHERSYLFAGKSGVGKSTHTRLWQQIFGDVAQVFNDDKPALRRLDDRWFAYGTPWCGKDGINQNKKVPLAGICFMKQGMENKIRRLAPLEAVEKLMPQTIYRFLRAEKLDLLLGHLDKLVREIPIYELVNRPEPEAAHLSYETMRRGAEEFGL